jgi:hypothetical protein
MKLQWLTGPLQKWLERYLEVSQSFLARLTIRDREYAAIRFVSEHHYEAGMRSVTTGKKTVDDTYTREVWYVLGDVPRIPGVPEGAAPAFRFRTDQQVWRVVSAYVGTETDHHPFGSFFMMVQYDQYEWGDISPAIRDGAVEVTMLPLADATLTMPDIEQSISAARPRAGIFSDSPSAGGSSSVVPPGIEYGSHQLLGAVPSPSHFMRFGMLAQAGTAGQLSLIGLQHKVTREPQVFITIPSPGSGGGAASFTIIGELFHDDTVWLKRLGITPG